jgi:hypothetical protein
VLIAKHLPLDFPSPSPLISHLALAVQYAGEKTQSPIVHARSHACFDCQTTGGAGQNGFWTHVGSSAPGLLGFSINSCIHIQEQEQSGRERASERTGVERQTHGHVMSCQVRRGSKQARAQHSTAQNRSPVRQTALLFGLALSGSRLAGAPRFPMALPTCACTAHGAADWSDGLMERGLLMRTVQVHAVEQSRYVC